MICGHPQPWRHSMRLNPMAVLFWIFCALIGYIVGGGVHSAAIGAACAIGFSVLLQTIL